MRIKDIMFSLLGSEINMAQLNADIHKNFTHETYEELYALSTKHDLSHIVASALSRRGLLGNDDISVKFNKQLMMAVYRDSQKEYALDQLGTLLENAKIPHIMLKGAIIRKFYPQSWMRTSCDVDVLVQKQDTEAAIELLCNAGYLRMEDSSTHDYNFMSPNNVHIELHYTLSQEGQITSSDKIFDEVWKSYVVPTEGYNFRYDLTAEVFILYHLAHMARHLLHGGCGVRPFIDLWLINKNMVVDNEKLNYLLNQANLLKFFELAVKLSNVWLENRKHSENTALLENFILSGGVYGTTQNAAKVKAASGRGKINSFLSLMFLPKENLQVIYPNLKKYPLLYPFYQVKRWFGFFNKKKRNKIKHLTEQRGKVTVDDTNKTAELLNQLGLN